MPLVIVLFGLFASLFTLQKDTLRVVEPFFLIGSRMTFAGIILTSFVMLFKRKQLPKFSITHIKPILALALANIYLTNLFEISGIKLMSSSKACLIYSLSPFLAAFVAFIVLHERLSKNKWYGMLIGFLGLIPVLYMQTATEISSGKIFAFSLAEVYMLGAVFFSVYGWILLKKVITEYRYLPLLANGISMLIGGLFAMLHSYLSAESWNPIPVSNYQIFITNSIVMCLISNIICYNLYGYLLKKFSATFMSFAGLSTPFFASFFGWYFLNEEISWHYYASMLLFSVGLTIFYLEELKQKRNLAMSL